jgi:hypothetical protein
VAERACSGRATSVLVMFKLLECCGNRSRHKTLYRPSRRSLAKAAGRSTEREEIITLTFVRKRDERDGVTADTGLKLHLDAKGMYVESVRPGSVGAPDGLEGCPPAIRLHSQLARSGGFSQRQIMLSWGLPSAPEQPRPASQPLWSCRPTGPALACRRGNWALAGRRDCCGQRAGVRRRAAGGEDDL